MRSGKVCGRGFMKRMKEHEMGAKAEKSSSNFYFMYPSQTSKRSEKRDRRGVFEILTPVIAAGFDPTSEIAKSVAHDFKEGGILVLSNDDKVRIKSSMKNKTRTEIEKFQSILAYQFEFGYDIAISHALNVSKSPGFESFLGIFGGE